ncbi:MAG: ATP-binding protein [Syntrophotaleaceae bacterium]
MDQKLTGQNKLIEDLTGVNASKLNYYAELKKRNEEISRQNVRLEILYRLSRAINLEMSVEDMIRETFKLLPRALRCELLGLAMLKSGELQIKTLLPFNNLLHQPVSRESFLWSPFSGKTPLLLSKLPAEDPFFISNPAIAEQLRSLVVIPLLQRSVAKGILLVGSFQSAAYTQEDLDFLQHLGDQLVISIQNAQLYEDVSRARKGWESTFNAVPDPILLIDTDHKLLLRNNRPLPKIVLQSAPAVIGEKCHAILYGRNTPCPDCPMDILRQTREPVYRRAETETQRVLDFAFYPVLGDNGELVAMTKTVKDVTEKSQMESRLLHSERLAAIGEMAAGVAHELNSPLTAIIGTAQLLRCEWVDRAELAESLEEVANCGLRCKRIIKNLLTFSRQDQVPMTETDLNREIERAMALVDYLIDKSDIRIIKNLAPDLPRIMANGLQIQQVVTNLMINARDALDKTKGPKTIQLETFLKECRDGVWAVVSVRDNGQGIEKENLQKIFTPFFTSKEATKGTGLGLSLSFGIAQAHGGTLEVESTFGEGSVFSLLLPLKNEGVGSRGACQSVYE